MSAITKGEATSEEALSSPLVYADLSRQFVQPFEESDSSVSTPPVLVAADENPEIEFNEQKPENGQPENFHNAEVNQPADHDYGGSVMEYEGADGRSGKAAGMSNSESEAIHSGKMQRRRSQKRLRRKRGNGLCPPHPPESVPLINWTEPTEIKLVFPKTYDYAVCAQARYSSQYLSLTKWRKEFDFFYDKYSYWCNNIQTKQLSSGRDLGKAKQLVAQLKWLLDHCWDGDESKQPVPEMLWRARKEEMRRSEQVLIRKQYYQREVAAKKKALSSTGRAANEKAGDKESSDGKKIASTTKKPFVKVGQASERAEIPPPVLETSSRPIPDVKEHEEKQTLAKMIPKQLDQNGEKNAHLFMLQFMVQRWGNATKQLETSKTTKSSNGPTVLRSHLEEYVKDLIRKYEEVKKSKDLDQEKKSIRVLMHRNDQLKRELNDNGFEWLTQKWIIFESKSPDDFINRPEKKSTGSTVLPGPSKSPVKLPTPNTTTLLKVRDYLDDDGKVDAMMTLTIDEPMATSTPLSSKTSKQRREAKAGKDVADIQQTSESTPTNNIPRPVPIKPARHLTDDEKIRLELHEVVAVETLWAKFAQSEAQKFKDDKEILDAIDAVLNACKSYRAVMEAALPKTVADLRRGNKLRKIHEAVAVLQTLIIERHEAKTGRRVDLGVLETPEIRFLRTRSLSFNKNLIGNVNSLNFGPTEQPEKDVSLEASAAEKRSHGIGGRLESDMSSPNKKLKRQDEEKEGSKVRKNGWKRRVPKFLRKETGVEMLATNRPKRHIKAPNRFVFDDEEKEEEERRRKGENGLPLKVRRGRRSNMKGREKIKFEQQRTGRKRKSSEKRDSSIPTLEPSIMEKIVVIPEEDSFTDDNNASVGGDATGSTNSRNETPLVADVINVTNDRYFRVDAGGNVNDGSRCSAVLHSDTTKITEGKAVSDVEEQAAQKLCKSPEIKYETEDRLAVERPVPSFDVHQEQQMSTAPQIFIENAGNSGDQIVMSADPQVLNGSSGSSNDLTVSSNDLTVTHREASTDSSNQLSSIGPCSSQTEPSENGDCGPWRQIAYRKEAALNGPPKLDKLKTQYDHLLMISEKNHVEKLRGEWMYVPLEGGPLDNKVKQIQLMIHELEDVLNSPLSTWKDYFNTKKYLQMLVNTVMADFSLLSGQAVVQLAPTVNIFSSSSGNGSLNDTERGVSPHDPDMRPKST